MKRIDWKVIVLLGIILSVVIGFAFGTGLLGGSAAEPGTEEDPLVTQSYADQSINNSTQDLAAQVEELTLKVQVLENDLTELYAMVGKTRSTVAGSTTGGTTTGTTGTGTTGTTGTTTTGTTGTTTGTTTTGTTTTGSETTSTVTANNIGKTATIAPDNNVVNLRKSASTSAEIVRKLSKTDTFTITKVDKDWYQVQLADGTTGWVAGWLVSVK